MKKAYKSIFISDIHLGTKGCKAKGLCDFLKHKLHLLNIMMASGKL
jgi:UDP-2,3-diacylglucosamine pyrophosphatase LpxH